MACFAALSLNETRFAPHWGRVFAWILLGLAFTVLLGAGSAQAAKNPRYASIVMDADTGLILSQRYADKKLHPASLVKIMTLLMTFDALESGKLGLRDRVVVSRHAASMVPSKLDLPAGSSIRVEDAIYALVTKSANDIAVALGEKLGGTESGFARQMNARARMIGMTHTNFRNASGLHDPRQATTARDMAILARYMIRTYPQYYRYFSTRDFTYRGQTYPNHNRLMSSYSGMDGLKTGYIQPSGFNLVASAKRNNRRIIGVVFGGRSASSRNAHMKQILDNGFAHLSQITVAQAVPVPGRKPAQVTVLADTSGMNIEDMSDWADLNPILQNRTFQALIGEGDYDPGEIRRLETGLTAIAAVKGVYTEQPATPQGGWAIQVGAFESRVQTDKIVRMAQQTLPAELNGGQPVIVPLKTRRGWLFRGRLTGYTREQALDACTRLKECLPVSPQAH